MANIRYVGAEPSTETFGKTFLTAEWTDDSGLDADALAILSQNPQFVVTEGKPDAKAKAAPEPEAAPEPPAAPEPEPVAAPSA